MRDIIGEFSEDERFGSRGSPDRARPPRPISTTYNAQPGEHSEPIEQVQARSGSPIRNDSEWAGAHHPNRQDSISRGADRNCIPVTGLAFISTLRRVKNTNPTRPILKAPNARPWTASKARRAIGLGVVTLILTGCMGTGLSADAKTFAVAKSRPTELCWWQVVTKVSEGEFMAWGFPYHGTRQEMQVVNDSHNSDQFVVTECGAADMKTPLWIKPPGMAKTSDVMGGKR